VARPVQQVLPATYDFGKVTSSNVPAPLELTVRNTGNAPLQVSSIALAAGASPSFSLGLGGGSKPCGSASATIAAGDQCTVEVAFAPASTGTFTASLQIASNDPTTPSTAVPIVGASEPVAALTVRINQIQSACPINGSNEVTAYVSVTDQGGYPVTGLLDNNFTVTQVTSPRALIAPVSYAEQTYQPIATAAALDFSSSLSNQSVAFSDMKRAFTSYFDAKRPDDIGEVVKFGSEVEVTQAFTSDKAALLAAIAAPFDKGGATKMYDAALQSVGDTAAQATARPTLRKAVIVATDGVDNASVRTLAEVAASAASQNVPIFTIGIGASINRTALEQLAADTGGLYYEANTSQNLATIYNQLSSVLYEKQYILKFDQLANGPGAASNVTVGVTSGALAGNATASLVSCN
jgi:Ca-activated chloride channel homolog